MTDENQKKLKEINEKLKEIRQEKDTFIKRVKKRFLFLTEGGIAHD